MDGNLQFNRSYELPVIAGTFRFFIGLTALIAGLFVALFTDFRGHGLGFLLAFGAPFIFLKDDK